MAGLLSFHAHPDDESLSCGGTLAHYAAAGRQVVVVTATDGVEGDIHDLPDAHDVGKPLDEVRAEELRAAIEILGVHHLAILGYRDSGMMGDDANDHPDSFWQADVQEASGRLVRLIRKYQPQVMTTYDPFGGYGHPDHMKVHEVGLHAFESAGDAERFPPQADEELWQPSKLYAVVWPARRLEALAVGWLSEGKISKKDLRRIQRGVPAGRITCRIDVSDHVDQKLGAIRAHRTQVPPDWPFLNVPGDANPESLAEESFVRLHGPGPERESELFEGL